jgi:GPH family glycoside/pentoside/hexuronide:cation symporter
MSLHSRHETSPQDRIPVAQKIFYGTGQISNMILALAITNLASFVLTVELGVSAFLVGLATGIPRLFDALTDPPVGYVSDNWRSRWGRRKPFLLVGIISVGLTLMLMWQMPRGWSEMAYFWFFLGMSLVYFLAYTLYATPFVALGYELSSDYHERTRLMGTMNFIGSLAAVPMAWLFAITQWDIFTDGIHGARVLAVILGVLVIATGLVPVIFLKDPTARRFQKREGAGESKAGLSFFDGLKKTLKNKNFRYICFATFAFFPGLTLVQNFSSFLVIYYLFDGNKSASSVLLGWSGTLSSFLGLAFIPLVTWLGTHFGKRQAFILCASAALFGTLIKWFCYEKSIPYLNLLPGPFIGLGFSALWVLMGSMMADVCDEDELHTHERREGTYSSVYWWIVKLGLSASLVVSGALLGLTGFEESLGAAQSPSTFFWMRICDIVFPALFIALSILFIRKFPITEARAYEIKQQLAARKQTV